LILQIILQKNMKKQTMENSK